MLMAYGTVLAAVALLSVMLLLPGLALAGAWRLPPRTRWAVAPLLGALAWYLLALVSYLVHGPRWLCLLLPLAAGAWLAARARGAGWPRWTAATRQLLLGQGLYSLWCLACQGVIRSYSGADWYGDWVEHYTRALFWLEHWPLDTKFLGGYLLTARPPLMNLLCGQVLGLCGSSFTVYLTATTLLNSLVFLPAVLLHRQFGGRAQPRGLLLAVLALNPMLVVSATYPWTRGLTACWVLTGLYLCVRAYRGRAHALAVLAFVLLAAGGLTHYSAGPYVVFAAAYLVLWGRRAFPRPWATVLACGLAGMLVMGTWFGWAVARYGTAGALASNTTLTEGAASHTSALTRTLHNAWATLVPPLCRAVEENSLGAPNALVRWRNQAFLVYQGNLLGSLGLLAGPLTALALLHAWARRRRPAAACGPLALAGFWPGLTASALVIGLLVVTWDMPLGMAHLTLQPLLILGLVWFAARLPQFPAPLRWAVLAGAGADFLLGIVLHLAVQAHPLAMGTNAAGRPLLLGTDGYDDAAMMNAKVKLRLGLQFLADISPWVSVGAAGLIVLLAGYFLWVYARAARGAPGRPT